MVAAFELQNVKSRIFFAECFVDLPILLTFANAKAMVFVVQLVRISDCGPEGRGFKSHRTPTEKKRVLFE